jgi:hypothetical protein
VGQFPLAHIENILGVGQFPLAGVGQFSLASRRNATPTLDGQEQNTYPDTLLIMDFHSNNS